MKAPRPTRRARVATRLPSRARGADRGSRRPPTPWPRAGGGARRRQVGRCGSGGRRSCPCDAQRPPLVAWLARRISRRPGRAQVGFRGAVPDARPGPPRPVPCRRLRHGRPAPRHRAAVAPGGRRAARAPRPRDHGRRPGGQPRPRVGGHRDRPHPPPRDPRRRDRARDPRADARPLRRGRAAAAGRAGPRRRARRTAADGGRVEHRRLARPPGARTRRAWGGSSWSCRASTSGGRSRSRTCTSRRAGGWARRPPTVSRSRTRRWASARRSTPGCTSWAYPIAQGVDLAAAGAHLVLASLEEVAVRP